MAIANAKAAFVANPAILPPQYHPPPPLRATVMDTQGSMPIRHAAWVPSPQRMNANATASQTLYATACMLGSTVSTNARWGLAAACAVKKLEEGLASQYLLTALEPGARRQPTPA